MNIDNCIHNCFEVNALRSRRADDLPLGIGAREGQQARPSVGALAPGMGTHRGAVGVR
jgi:hypothetical protein